MNIPTAMKNISDAIRAWCRSSDWNSTDDPFWNWDWASDEDTRSNIQTSVPIGVPIAKVAWASDSLALVSEHGQIDRMYEELELSSVGHIHNDLRLIPIVTGVFIGI
jgi:hypothetical protein